MLKSPRLAEDHPDRQIDCEEMLEAALVTLMDAAGDQGWHQEEIAQAVCELARNYVLRLAANADTDRQIANTSGCD